MWLCTQYGFYSIVQKTPGVFHVRARVKRDLEDLRKAGGFVFTISTSPDADYRYRTVVDGSIVQAILLHLATHLEYSNFKSKIAETPAQRHKLDAYHDIWETMYQVQIKEKASP